MSALPRIAQFGEPGLDFGDRAVELLRRRAELFEDVAVRGRDRRFRLRQRFGALRQRPPGIVRQPVDRRKRGLHRREHARSIRGQRGQRVVETLDLERESRTPSRSPRRNRPSASEKRRRGLLDIDENGLHPLPVIAAEKLPQFPNHPQCFGENFGRVLGQRLQDGLSGLYLRYRLR